MCNDGSYHALVMGRLPFDIRLVVKQGPAPTTVTVEMRAEIPTEAGSVTDSQVVHARLAAVAVDSVAGTVACCRLSQR